MLTEVQHLLVMKRDLVDKTIPRSKAPTLTAAEVPGWIDGPSLPACSRSARTPALAMRPLPAGRKVPAKSSAGVSVFFAAAPAENIPENVLANIAKALHPVPMRRSHISDSSPAASLA